MQTFPTLINAQLQKSLETLSLDLPEGFTPQTVSSTDSKFGDYQTNTALVLGKFLKTNPRELAQKIIAHLHIDDLCTSPEIAGPGFINFRIRREVYESRLEELAHDPRCGVATVTTPQRILIEFSSPNIAKPMHVGHIRSTIIGDCLARITRFLGHHVITDNHIGDWGTQFGMILYGWKHFLQKEKLQKNPIEELVRIYRQVTSLTKKDKTILDTCKQELVKLQQGDQENLAIWKECVALSLQDIQTIYDKLNIHFDHFLGESFYNSQLAPLVKKLLAKGLAEESDGAICIFFKDHPELADHPFLIRKSDGGFLYATTDIATIDYRVKELKAEKIWYIVGAPQILHFKQLFEAAKRNHVHSQLVHIPFGSILGEDRKIMKTRSGENIALAALLEEGVDRAQKKIAEKNPSLDEEEKKQIAEIIGIGAIKYAELSQHRMTDYIFSWEKMLSLQGNTAPYLQNAYVRIRSIFRKLDNRYQLTKEIQLTEPAEKTLLLKLCQFSEVVPEVLTDYKPNILANYLYELAVNFHSFYEACPILQSEQPMKNTRLLLCETTAKILAKGLDLLGIQVVERM